MPYYCVPERDRAALLTLSAQRDFLRHDSPVRVYGAACAVPALARVVRGFRHRGAAIFHAVRLYRPDGTNVDACRRQSIEEGMRFLMPGSLGAELIDEVRPSAQVRLDPDCLMGGRMQQVGAAEWAFYRPRWGAFHETGLEARLRQAGVTTLVICGLSFATGTRATIYEASARDFRTVVVPDALGCASDEGVKELGRLGIYLMTSENCLTWLAGERPNRAA